MTNLRTLPAGRKGTRKMVRRAQEQADRDGATFCVVEYEDHVFIRPQVRAGHLVAKHAEAHILETCQPIATGEDYVDPNDARESDYLADTHEAVAS